MLQSKRAFEKYSSSHGIQIKNHRADNGKLSYNAFLHSCNNEGQTSPFCGVNTRWQNGVAKKKKGSPVSGQNHDAPRKDTLSIIHIIQLLDL